MGILRALLLLDTLRGLAVHAAVLRGNHVFDWLHRLEPLASRNASESVHIVASGTDSVHFVAGVPKIKVRKARAISGSGGSHSHASANMGTHVILDVKCNEPFAGPNASAFCPEDCPYMRFDPDRMCHFKCITKDWCLNAPNMPSSFPDDKLGKCIPCQVPGCKDCLSPTQCKINGCSEGFDMKNGECLPQSRQMWRTIIGVLVVLVAIITVYLIRVWSRPVTQSVRLKQAQLFRSMSKLRHATVGHPLIAWNTNLCNEVVCGIGVLLHFRFQMFWLVWAFVVLVISGCLSFYLGRFKASDALAMTPTHEEVFRQCEDFGSGTAVQLYLIQESFTWLAGGLYVFTTLACFAFAVAQQQASLTEDEITPSMEDFALCACHMPVEIAKDHLEEDYLKFFRSVYGDDVIGVSICWDYSEHQEAIENATSGQLHGHDKMFDNLFLTGDELKKLEEETGPKKSEGSEDRSCQFPEMRCLDTLMCGNTPDEDEATNTAIAKLVRGLKTTGFVFMILHTEIAQKAALDLQEKHIKEGKKVFYPGCDLPIRIQREQWDPATVLWNGFSVRKRERRANIRNGILIILLVIAVWAICFYGPYVVYVLSWSSVAGATQGDATTMSLLGVMCAIGNQVVYFTCAKVADNAGFRSKDHAMAFNCCLYTLAVLLNIIVDIALMVVMAHGFQQDSGMDPTAAIRNPSFQYSLFLQLVGYLYPMTLLVPYLAEPLPMNIIPYFLGKWMIRSAARISRYNAEQALVCPEFDLLRYGDIIINVSTVIACLFLASSSLWWIFMWLFVSNSVIYIWDHIRLLRFCEKTEFENDYMETCSQYISALPCGILAAAFTFKKFNGEEVLKSFDIDVARGAIRDFSTSWSDINSSIWFYVVGAGVLHICFHVLVVRFVVPLFVHEKGSPCDATYEEISQAYPHTWFNSNPVHCLRSQAFGGLQVPGWEKHDPPIIFHQRGKEYVHKKNDHICQYYNGTDNTEYEKEFSRAQAFEKSVSDRMSKLLKRKRSKLEGQTPREGIDHLDDTKHCIIS